MRRIISYIRAYRNSQKYLYMIHSWSVPQIRTKALAAYTEIGVVGTCPPLNLKLSTIKIIWNTSLLYGYIYMCRILYSFKNPHTRCASYIHSLFYHSYTDIFPWNILENHKHSCIQIYFVLWRTKSDVYCAI